ncbi:uncharacterized protein LOC124413582 isoform X3 [Diprion similis]|uniref:uncharacterized protein LOC124413582 isoform X3 n=1 Tax=Diprion similis TaxID=362088 RepID=UPI001EF83146|nr:uncharacterized protein LOC124413582 isoform X3 [Diprion similis]
MSEVPAPMIHSQTAGSLLLPQIHNSADSSPNVSPAGSSIESPISSPLKIADDIFQTEDITSFADSVPAQTHEHR